MMIYDGNDSDDGDVKLMAIMMMMIIVVIKGLYDHSPGHLTPVPNSFVIVEKCTW